MDGLLILLQGLGFVRSYNYHHPNSKITIIVTTGYHADHWNAMDGSKEVGSGLWSSLEPFIKKISNEFKGEVK